LCTCAVSPQSHLTRPSSHIYTLSLHDALPICTVSTSSLTFTAGNWSTPQTITVTGVQDFTNDGNQAYTVTTGVAASSDPLYNGLDRKSTRLNSSHQIISYAVFCLKKTQQPMTT